MRIGELAKVTGLAASRIRFYEASGLFRAKRRANGYRDYDPEATVVLEIISSAQSVGFSLEQIRDLLPLNSETWRHDRLLDALQRKVADIEALQKRLKRSRALLLTAIETMENRPPGLTCADNTKRVLTGLRKKGLMAQQPRAAARR